MTQDEKSLVEKIEDVIQPFNFDGSSFFGMGWNFIIEEVQTSQYILIGEDHFSNEIPNFISAVADMVKFDNFYIEVDKYTVDLIENSFSLDEDEKNDFNRKYQDLFSFYSLEKEYELLKKFVTSGTDLFGSEQIVMYADRLLSDHLVQITENDEARDIYQRISEKSEEHFNNFLNDPQNNFFYFMTEEFGDTLSRLEALSLSEKEEEMISDMRLSVDIYKNQDHNLRVKLLLHQVLVDYPKWKEGKTLFKYGASHLCRGESFLYVHDIGNLVSTLSRANFARSCHIMILGMSGEVGSPFRNFPTTEVDSKNGFYLSYLQPFFESIRSKGDSTSWFAFDLRPLRKALVSKEYNIDIVNLERAIKGYDILVIVPELTPGNLINFE